MATFGLVLFDVDGCTAIVECKKLMLEGKDLVTGQQGYMMFGRDKLKVEILQLSGNYYMYIAAFLLELTISPYVFNIENQSSSKCPSSFSTIIEIYHQY
jgi:hypothetical protein